MNRTVQPRLERGSPKKKGTLAFLLAFVRSPKDVGTCFASGPALAAAMIDRLGLAEARTVIELGAGTGPITEAILERIPSGCRFYAIERDPDLAAVLQKRCPGVRVLARDATELRSICAEEGISAGSADAVVCSLPLMALPLRAEARIIRESSRALKPGGMFTMVTYWKEGMLPAVRRCRVLMERRLGRVLGPVTVTENLPSAYVYRCVKSGPTGDLG
ncbi:MAG: methyltransferase domain-containing protein [Phycisphaeraceae bacterium]|nr:methyltransferase domain-containing protein [Phycisphaeraceae bacterium]